MTDIFNNIFTRQSETYRVLALEEFIGQSAFFAIGKLNSWSDADQLGATDTDPPTPDKETVTPSPVIYKRAQIISPAIQSDLGTFEGSFKTINENQATKWHLIKTADLARDSSNYIVYPTKLYISCSLDLADLPTPTFRAVGLHTGVQLLSGVDEGKVVYDPSEIVDTGLLQWLSYSTPVTLQANKRTVIGVLL